MRLLSAELTASRAKVTQLDHVVRAKEREMGRVRDEKDAGRAAERERVKVRQQRQAMHGKNTRPWIKAWLSMIWVNV